MRTSFPRWGVTVMWENTIVQVFKLVRDHPAPLGLLASLCVDTMHLAIVNVEVATCTCLNPGRKVLQNFDDNLLGAHRVAVIRSEPCTSACVYKSFVYLFNSVVYHEREPRRQRFFNEPFIVPHVFPRCDLGPNVALQYGISLISVG
jgi:hypothetical protein